MATEQNSTHTPTEPSFDFDLARSISTIAAKATDSERYWVSTPSGEYETNNGNDWCRTCARFVLRHLRKKDRKNAADYILDGGWRTESDTHSFCAHCGCWLRVSLTDSGVEEELHHYRENGIGLNSVVDEAYSLDLLMDAVSWGGAHEEEVQALARQFVAIPQVAEIITASEAEGR